MINGSIFETWFNKRFGTEIDNGSYREVWKRRFEGTGLDAVLFMDSTSLSVLCEVLQEQLQNLTNKGD